MPSREVVRLADDLAPIVHFSDDLARIVRRLDDLRGGMWCAFSGREGVHYVTSDGPGDSVIPLATVRRA